MIIGDTDRESVGSVSVGGDYRDVSINYTFSRLYLNYQRQHSGECNFFIRGRLKILQVVFFNAELYLKNLKAINNDRMQIQVFIKQNKIGEIAGL